MELETFEKANKIREYIEEVGQDIKKIEAFKKTSAALILYNQFDPLQETVKISDDLKKNVLELAEDALTDKIIKLEEQFSGL